MATLDDAYLHWLYTQVASDRYQVRTKTYWSLMRQLYTKPFSWLIPNDDNRVSDGVALRDQFVAQLDIQDADPFWMGLQCSTLEMLVALSNRIAFEEGGETSYWFWHLLGNLGLSQINDAEYDDLHREGIDEAIDRMIWRTYLPNGKGGLFPLRHAEEDQRVVELWYQMNAYLMERDV